MTARTITSTQQTTFSSSSVFTRLPAVLKYNCRKTIPKLVPFFKTVAIFFVLFPDANSKQANIFYLIFKCLPMCSLILFVLLHGMNLRFEYSYARRIMTGLVFSMLGDAFLVFDHLFFIHGVLAFGISHIIYATAYGMRPLRLLMIPFMLAPVILSWAMFSSVLYKPLSYVIYLYILLTMIMIWRAIARLKFDDKEWTWTRFYSFLGGLLFATSDLLLALDRFVTPLPGSQILIMATYYSAQLLITLSVVDSREDIEINHCVIQETDIIKVLQEQGKLLSQVHKDDILAILTTKRQLIHNTFANTQLLTLLMEKKIQLGANIDSLLNKTNILLFVNQHEQQKPKKNTHRHRRRTKRDQQNSDTMSSRTNSSSDTDNESKRIKISADEILIKRKHTINTDEFSCEQLPIKTGGNNHSV